MSSSHIAVTEEAPAPGRNRSAWPRFARQPGGAAALGLLVLLYVAAVLGPLVYRVSPTLTNPLFATAGPSPQHWLGTDELGRDLLARLLYGGRVTLSVGLVSMLVAMLVGTLVGALGGYYRGWVEIVLMRLVDVFMAVPAFFLILAELTVFGRNPAVVVIVVGLSFWMQVARIVHGEFVRYREREFVEAQHALGAPDWRIIFLHILPQALPSAVVLTTLGVAWSVMTETGLSYLGLGIQPPLASWGNMLQNAQTYLWTKPLLAVYPGALIALTVLSFNMLGNALRDVLDPKL
ncbi:MAG: ABC transporter permease [Firmicutes bacterium]|nr:ABC transporter permease [Bacillota bacterium]